MKQTKKKERTILISIDPKNYNLMDGLVLDFKTMKILGKSERKTVELFGSTSVSSSYQRENGKTKYLNSNTASNKEKFWCPNHQLLSYDHLIAIDTNTKKFNASSVSITAAVHLIPGKSTSNGILLEIALIGLMEYWNTKDKPENFGWWKILEAIQKQRNRFTGRIAVTVDSDLGEHVRFMAREKPLYDNFYLPKQMDLIYASADVGSEYLQNKLIKLCDKVANQLYTSENLVLNPKGIIACEDYCSHYRQWDVQNFDILSLLNIKTPTINQ